MREKQDLIAEPPAPVTLAAAVSDRLPSLEPTVL